MGVFKGKCRNCGRQGHNSSDCKEAQLERSERTKHIENGDNFKITCNFCKKRGQFLNECTEAPTCQYCMKKDT